jgi:DNA-binding XRE family transcriptional regulator
MSNEELERSPLVELREKAGLTQEALAAALGVTDHTVRNWEKGRSEPKLTIKQMKELCSALRCGLNDLPDSFAPQNKSAEA